ncbi:hypothetical protein ACFY19_21195 [Streptosporangium saharense]|uniref:hypothetical protein n=1 Tax=Streptosporangium saharense TaxID=1706840 RepID=UPI0036C8B070
MPHTNDKHVFDEVAEILGGPRPLHHSARVNGKRVIDTPNPGQREFQSLLARCLFSKSRTTPWDLMVGRSFYELRSYFSLVSPQLDSLVIVTNTATRIASYLLPYTRSHSQNFHECAGIPGLRVDGYGRGMIRLKHLPTNGVLELRDTNDYPKSCGAQWTREVFEGEIGRNRDSDCRSASWSSAWRKSHMDKAEEASFKAWPTAWGTPLFSGILARAQILWYSHWSSGLLTANQFTSAPYRLDWDENITVKEFGRLLTESAIRIDGAKFEISDHNTGRGLLSLGDTQLELSGPRDGSDQ